MTHTGDIISQIHAARGDRKALLSLASDETCDGVAAHFNVAPVVAAPKVAQRVFDAKSITIKGTQQTRGSKFKRRYDLTDPNQAYDALSWWATAKESLAWWELLGDIDAYAQTCAGMPSLYRHCVQSLKLIRHSG